MTSIHPDFLRMLACPLTKADLILRDERLISTDVSTRRAYSFNNTVPDMLIDHSQVLEEDVWAHYVSESFLD